MASVAFTPYCALSFTCARSWHRQIGSVACVLPIAVQQSFGGPPLPSPLTYPKHDDSSLNEFVQSKSLPVGGAGEGTGA